MKLSWWKCVCSLVPSGLYCSLIEFNFKFKLLFQACSRIVMKSINVCFVEFYQPAVNNQSIEIRFLKMKSFSLIFYLEFTGVKLVKLLWRFKWGFLIMKSNWRRNAFISRLLHPRLLLHHFKSPAALDILHHSGICDHGSARELLLLMDDHRYI